MTDTDQATNATFDPEEIRRRFPFGETVGFLVSQIGAATARRFKEVLEHVELEPRQFALLWAIEAADGVPQHVLSGVLQIPASTLVGILDTLEARALVARRAHPTDRRARMVELTTEGRALLGSASSIAMPIELELCGDLTAEERASLVSMLQRVAENVGLARGVHPELAEQ